MFVLLFSILLTPIVSTTPRADPLFTDADGDGYKGIVEVWWGCDQFDPASLPYCLPGSEIPNACSATIPGAALYPC